MVVLHSPLLPNRPFPGCTDTDSAIASFMFPEFLTLCDCGGSCACPARLCRDGTQAIRQPSHSFRSKCLYRDPVPGTARIGVLALDGLAVARNAGLAMLGGGAEFPGLVAVAARGLGVAARRR